MNSEEKIREKIVHKFNENPNWSGRMIAKSLKLHAQTVNRVLKRFKETLSIKRKPGAGRKPGAVDPQLTNKVIRSCKQNPSLSDQERAQRFGTSRTNIRKIRYTAAMKSYRVVKRPNRTDKQQRDVKTRSRKLYENFLTKHDGCCIMDDETYVKLDFSQLPGYNYYVAMMRGSVASQFKFSSHDKFAKKLMIWQAICSCGLKSKVFVTSATMTSDLYIKECLQKRLLPFLRAHNNNAWFWPDLASCHYSRSTLEWFERNGVTIVPKDMNPPNCPQFRPIERYWAIVKRKLKKTKGAARNAATLRNKWNQHAAKVSKGSVQNLMAVISRRVRAFLRDSGQLD